MAIAAFGMLGFFGLLFGMREAAKDGGDASAGAALHGLRAILNPKLLGGTLVTVMLIYGVLAAVGSIMGGRMTDRLGADRASLIIVAGIAGVVFGMWLLAYSPVGMAVLVALLGVLSYAAVPALQARLIGIAEVHAPRAHGVAAGLNIAGFNSGIALGSLLGQLRSARWAFRSSDWPAPELLVWEH